MKALNLSFPQVSLRLLKPIGTQAKQNHSPNSWSIKSQKPFKIDLSWSVSGDSLQKNADIQKNWLC